MLLYHGRDLSRGGKVSTEPTPAAPVDVVSEDAPSLSKIHTIQIRFRDNEVYLTTIDQVANILRRHGYRVIIDSFPPGTKEGEIDQTLSDSVADLQGTVFFTDYKVRSSWNVSVTSQKAIGIAVAPALDEMYCDVTQALVKKKFGLPEKIHFIDAQTYLEEYGRCYSTVLREAFKNCMPERFDIVREDLTQHTPFFSVFCTKPVEFNHISREAFVRAYKDTKYLQELLPILSSAYGFEVQEPATYLKRWVEAAGMPAEKIRIVDTPMDLFDPNYPLHDGVFINADRHVIMYDERQCEFGLVLKLVGSGCDKQHARDLRKQLDKLVILQNPLENLMFDLVEWKLLREKHAISEDELVQGVAERMLNNTEIGVRALEAPAEKAKPVEKTKAVSA